ncbi:MAG TPA: hypothetical protein DGU45_07780 [Planctomycetes bacterium]|nr:hypothetical protein [Planctomycetota bacterium]
MSRIYQECHGFRGETTANSSEHLVGKRSSNDFCNPDDLAIEILKLTRTEYSSFGEKHGEEKIPKA